MSDKYIIYINGTAVEVSEELYRYYKRSEKQIRYAEKGRRHPKIVVKKDTVTVKRRMEESLDELVEYGEDFPDTTNICETAIQKIIIEQALTKLNDKERNLIVQLFYFGRTEREIADELGIQHNSVHFRKNAILKKLRKIIDGD